MYKGVFNARHDDHEESQAKDFISHDYIVCNTGYADRQRLAWIF